MTRVVAVPFSDWIAEVRPNQPERGVWCFECRSVNDLVRAGDRWHCRGECWRLFFERQQLREARYDREVRHASS